jgi:hypothetical protein
MSSAHNCWLYDFRALPLPSGGSFICVAPAMILDTVTLLSFLQPHLMVFTVSQSSHGFLMNS